MSAKATFWAWEQEEITSNELLVLLCYSNFANENDASWPSKVRVSRMTKLSKSTVKRAVNSLCKKGLMTPSGVTETSQTGDQKTRETIRYKLDCTGVTVSPVQGELGSNQGSSGVTEASSGVTVSPKPNNNLKKEPTKPKWGKSDAIALPLPTNVPHEAWVNWVDYRWSKKKPISEKSAEAQIEFLSEQPNPADVINASIRNDWQGLFPDKTGEKTNGKPKQSLYDRLADSERQHSERPRPSNESRLEKFF